MSLWSHLSLMWTGAERQQVVEILHEALALDPRTLNCHISRLSRLLSMPSAIRWLEL